MHLDDGRLIRDVVVHPDLRWRRVGLGDRLSVIGPGPLRDTRLKCEAPVQGRLDRLPDSRPVDRLTVAGLDHKGAQRAAVLGRGNVLGFVMDEGGNTSHVAILARSLGVPAVVGLGGPAVKLQDQTMVALDGTDGLLIRDPDEETTEHFAMLSRNQVKVTQKLEHLRDLPAVTPDGHRVRMFANIELPVEVDEAVARGAEGIGLLRTEYLFFQHNTIPTEDDQEVGLDALDIERPPQIHVHEVRTLFDEGSGSLYGLSDSILPAITKQNDSSSHGAAARRSPRLPPE